MSLPELINVMLEQVHNKENDHENPFEIAFNSSCGENYAYNLNYLDESRIRDIVSGGLCSGPISGFDSSDRALLLGTEHCYLVLLGKEKLKLQK